MSKKLLAVVCFALLMVGWASCAQTKGQDIFSPKQVRLETRALRRLSVVTKKKIHKAIDLLNDAILTASVSADFEEVASASHNADKAISAFVDELPRGILKGSLRACQKALGDSFILRVANKGGLDLEGSIVAGKLEEIMLRYQLTKYPMYERPSRVLDFARVNLGVAKKIASRLSPPRT